MIRNGSPTERAGQGGQQGDQKPGQQQPQQK